MKKYLATLHTKPDRHKKRFALLVSGGITLAIFTIWCLVTFNTPVVVAEDSQAEVGPLESLREGMASSIEGLSQVFDTMKAGFGALNTYGE